MVNSTQQNFAEIKMADGSTVLILVEGIQPGGYQRVSRDQESGIFSQVTNTFEEALKGIEPTLNALKRTLDAVAPDQVSVEFNIGFKLSTTKALAFIGSTEGSGSIKVSMNWKRS